MKTRTIIFWVVVFTIALGVYTKATAQVSNRYEFLAHDKGKDVMYIKPDSTMVIYDSLKAIKLLYRALLNEKKQKDMLAKEIFNAIIENKKRNYKTN